MISTVVPKLLIFSALAVLRQVTALPGPDTVLPVPPALVPRASETPYYSSPVSANTITSTASAIPPAESDVGGYLNDDDYDFPTLPGFNSELLASLSSIDSSINQQVSSAIAGMSSAPCIGVPDISGTPVTLCGPTAESATGTAKSSGLAVAGTRPKLGAVAVAIGLVGGLVM
jgi:hypothetical protein